jgi:hypothetical protein
MTSWQRPVLGVDVDGVLNPYGGPCPPGYAEHRLLPRDPAPVRLCPRHGEWLRELSRELDLVWATAWNNAERALLARTLELPTFSAAIELPTPPFEPVAKVDALDALVPGTVPLAWLDDQHASMQGRLQDWVSARPADTLIVTVEPSGGLTAQHVATIRAWARHQRT